MRKNNFGKTFRSYLFVILSVISISLFTGSTFKPARNIDSTDYCAKIDSFITKAIHELDFKAGFSISVVKDNKVIFSKGYGYRNIEEKLPVEDDTPFYIASATKSFVAEAVKILADEGRLNLDSSISKYLPELHLNEPLSTETISIRDLLTHRSGMENLPVVLRTAYTGDYSDSLLMKLLDSSAFMGHQFRYTNLGYVLTGIIIEKVTGKSWQEIVEEKIFKPLKMNSTQCKVSLYNQTLLALPYNITNNKITKIEKLKDDKTMHAAGGIITTAHDAANWLIFNINNGVFKDSQLVSPGSMNEIHSAQINLASKFYYYKRFAYGLGWYLSDYNGELLIHHFGGFAGFRSHISFMPKYRTGVAAFVNDDSEGYYLPDLVADYVYNLLKGDKNYEAITERELEEYKAQLKKLKEESVKKGQQNPAVKIISAEINNLKGSYCNSQFGQLDIIVKDNSLIAQMGYLTGEITKNAEGVLTVNFPAFKSKIDTATPVANSAPAKISLSSIPWPDKEFIKIK